MNILYWTFKMFGVSVKVWQMEEEGEEFSVVITHNSSVKNFLLVLMDLLDTDFLVGQQTIENITSVSIGHVAIQIRDLLQIY